MTPATTGTQSGMNNTGRKAARRNKIRKVIKPMPSDSTTVKNSPLADVVLVML
jgi:hypothetical protein